VNEIYEMCVKNIVESHMLAAVICYPIVLSGSRKPELGRIKIRFADYALSFHVETWSVARHST